MCLIFKLQYSQNQCLLYYHGTYIECWTIHVVIDILNSLRKIKYLWNFETNVFFNYFEIDIHTKYIQHLLTNMCKYKTVTHTIILAVRHLNSFVSNYLGYIVKQKSFPYHLNAAGKIIRKIRRRCTKYIEGKEILRPSRYIIFFSIISTAYFCLHENYQI